VSKKGIEMQEEHLLAVSYNNWLLGDEYAIEYFQTRFELREELAIVLNHPVLEIVSTVEYDAEMLNGAKFIDVYDARYGESYCLDTSLIKGFKQIPFDVIAWNANVMAQLPKGETA
jgi:hypothetical protein